MSRRGGRAGGAQNASDNRGRAAVHESSSVRVLPRWRHRRGLRDACRRRRRAGDCRRADAGADDGDAARPPRPADRHQPYRRVGLYPRRGRRRRHRRHHAAMRHRARCVGRSQGAAVGARHPQHRARRHARTRHHRRFARQCRSGGGDFAGGADARRHLELSRRRQDRRDRGARFPCRADDHQPAGRRVSDRRALSGVAGQSRHRFPRGERAQQRFRFRLGGGASRACRRTMQTHRHRRRRGDGSSRYAWTAPSNG